MEYSPSKASDIFRMQNILTVSQAVLGLGVGLLLAGKFKQSARKTTGITLLSVGAVSAVTWLVDMVVRQVNQPGSNRSMRRSLQSIRENSGLHDEQDGL